MVDGIPISRFHLYASSQLTLIPTCMSEDSEQGTWYNNKDFVRAAILHLDLRRP